MHDKPYSFVRGQKVFILLIIQYKRTHPIVLNPIMYTENINFRWTAPLQYLLINFLYKHGVNTFSIIHIWYTSSCWFFMSYIGLLLFGNVWYIIYLLRKAWQIARILETHFHWELSLCHLDACPVKHWKPDFPIWLKIGWFFFYNFFFLQLSTSIWLWDQT